MYFICSLVYIIKRDKYETIFHFNKYLSTETISEAKIKILCFEPISQVLKQYIINSFSVYIAALESLSTVLIFKISLRYQAIHAHPQTGQQFSTKKH